LRTSAAESLFVLSIGLFCSSGDKMEAIQCYGLKRRSIVVTASPVSWKFVLSIGLLVLAETRNRTVLWTGEELHHGECSTHQPERR
jgi:hypothetical protein